MERTPGQLDRYSKPLARFIVQRRQRHQVRLIIWVEGDLLLWLREETYQRLKEFRRDQEQETESAPTDEMDLARDATAPFSTGSNGIVTVSSGITSNVETHHLLAGEVTQRSVSSGISNAPLTTSLLLTKLCQWMT